MNCLLPQNVPRITAYTDVSMSPGSSMTNISMLSPSGKRNDSISRPKNNIIAAGTVNSSVPATPAETTACLPAKVPVALCFAIIRDTVTGIPLDAIVKNTEKTERHIW